MDLYAYIQKDEELINKYIDEHYDGQNIPRYRGVRFMKTERKVRGLQRFTRYNRMFNKYVGKDVVYIHTRCGGVNNRKLFDTYQCSNYRYYRADKWEEGLKDLLINHVDEWDRTYASHYFKAVINEDYNNIIKSLEENNAK